MFKDDCAMATTAAPALRFTRVPHPAPATAQVRAEVLANPGFGTKFSDHMVSIEWTEAEGWHKAEILPYGPIALDPAAAVLHYAQEIFEGLKAYRLADGGIALFRPEANAARFNASARRLAMAEIPEDLFVRRWNSSSSPMQTGSPRSKAARSTCARSCSRRKPSSACARPRPIASW
jgi:hypothetical protein